MLRVGLTGGLGSGKSTVAAILRHLGAHVIEADELGRKLMEPGQSVYEQIVDTFGPGAVGSDGRLNRPRLAEMAFQGGRLEELNDIVHPAVIMAQMEWMRQIFEADSRAIAIVESALIFEVERDARRRGADVVSQSATGHLLLDWRNRFDRVMVVTVPDEVKIARYAARIGTEQAAADARSRLAKQMPDAEKAARADYVIENTGDLAALRTQVVEVWQRLSAESN